MSEIFNNQMYLLLEHRVLESLGCISLFLSLQHYVAMGGRKEKRTDLREGL